jgi:glyoxylase-like metal-dependent hydrolase (beta-lactamase superfamily II)
MNIHIVETGFFKLDGGAMFGVVPKSMWNKLNPADENNMCTWAMRCLLIEVDDRLILIDTGMGNKQDEKFRSHFYPHGNESLNSSIAKLGFSTEDITDVILTHLHFDHCGGAVYRSENGALLSQFPKAKYWSHSVHLNWALNPNDREKASFLKENIEPLVQSNQLFFIYIDPFG